MDRRQFLAKLTGGLAATAALAAVDPEFLLWRPGAKTIFLPPAPTLATAVDPWILSASQMLKGDIFTVDGYYSINPLTGKPTGHLQQFVVTEDHTPGSVGFEHITPKIVTTEPLRRTQGYTWEPPTCRSRKRS